MKKRPTPNPMTLRTKGAEKNANNLGTFLLNIPIQWNLSRRPLYGTTKKWSP